MPIGHGSPPGFDVWRLRRSVDRRYDQLVPARRPVESTHRDLAVVVQRQQSPLRVAEDVNAAVGRPRESTGEPADGAASGLGEVADGLGDHEQTSRGRTQAWTQRARELVE